ncbi:MAG: SPOR domain-containing protein [Proteobacteria bacterium]|nr:SPOR domain-containing protein [Pseudomonadota bacterium]
MKLPGKRGKDASRAPNGAVAGAQAQSEETLRIRARRRLIGAVVLVLTGVVVFPLIFETQPKPVVSSMSLVIPSQNQASIASAPAPRVPAADVRAAAAIAESSPDTASTPQGLDARSKALASPLPNDEQQSKAGHTAQHLKTPTAGSQSGATANQSQETPAAKPSPATRQAPAAAVAAPTKHQQTQRQIASARVALAALEGKQPDQISTQQAEAALAKSAGMVAAPSSARYVIQAGAYADTRVAHQVRQKIEHAGFKTYTQVVDTAGGKRIRVRVGPFASRQEADKALARIKALGLAAVVLTL